MSTNTMPAAFDDVEAFPRRTASTTDLGGARAAARTTTDSPLLAELWAEWGRRVLGPLLENPVLPEDLLQAVGEEVADDPLARRQVDALRAARSVRGLPADQLSRSDALLAAYDPARPSNDLRILHYRFGQSVTVGVTLASNPSVPKDLLEKLSRHPAGMVRRAARDRLASQRTGVNVQLMVARARGGAL
ncbi:MAG: hypothetical protein V4737_10675 [Curtobacterium sp.]